MEEVENGVTPTGAASEEPNEELSEVVPNDKMGRRFGFLQVVFGVIIVVGVGLVLGLQLQVQDSQEVSRQNAREIIAENLELKFLENRRIAMVIVDDVKLGVLPNDAFALTELSSITRSSKLFLTFRNCTLTKVEENAFSDENFLTMEEVVVNFAENLLEELPSSIFSPFAENLTSLNLTLNNFKTVANSVEMFTDTRLERIILDENRDLTDLPLLSLNSSFVSSLNISCANCTSLEKIEVDYCSIALPEGQVFLNLSDSLLAKATEAPQISFLTDCREDDITENPFIFRKASNCSDILEFERDIWKKALRDAERSVLSGTEVEFIVSDIATNACLPNFLFELIDISEVVQNLQENNFIEIIVDIVNKSIVEIEPKAFFDDRLQEFSVLEQITVRLNINKLTTLDSELFTDIRGQNFSLDLGENFFEDVPNSVQVFEGIGLKELNFSNNPLKSLPLIGDLSPLTNELNIFCIDCTELELIESSFCSKALSSGTVSLDIFDTPISDLLEVSLISEITECAEENINEDERKQRDLVDCQGIIEIERELLRQLIADNAQITLENTLVTVSVSSINVPCLPNQALSKVEVDIALLPKDFDLEIVLESCEISELEGDAFGGNIAFLNGQGRVSIALFGNTMSAFPSDLLVPFQNRLSRFDVGGNRQLSEVPNAGELFAQTGANFLDFSNTNMESLPLPLGVNSQNNEITIACRGCRFLSFIEPNYCNLVLPTGTVTLDFRENEPNAINEASLADRTGCDIDNILGPSSF